MKKIIFLLIIVVSMMSCNSEKKDFIIKLQSELGYGVFMPTNKIVYPNHDSIDYKGIPDEINEFVVRTVSLQRNQSKWELYKKGKIEKAKYFDYISRNQIDTTKLANIFYDYLVTILIGTNKKGKRIIMVDANNDEDFSGEEILEYEFPLSLDEQKKIKDSLPSILTNYEFYYEGNVIDKSVRLIPSPYKGSLGLSYNTKSEVEKKYDLFISLPKYKKGKVIIDNVKFNFFISNGFASQYFTNKKTDILFSQSENRKPSELNGDILNHIGDIINIKNKDYLLDAISFWGDTLKLKYLGENIRPIGIIEGKYIPQFEAHKLDESVLNLEEYQGKYILFDFWATWCKPCIASVPELKALNTEFENKNLKLIGVAYDKDPQKVREFVKKEQMNWEHVFVNLKGKDKKSLVEKFKVTSFPTTILIAPDGKIIARNKTFEQLKEILENAPQ